MSGSIVLLLNYIMVKWMVLVCFVLYCINDLYHIVLHCVAIFCNVLYHYMCIVEKMHDAMVWTCENGDFIGKNSDFGGKYYTIHGNSQEVWYQTVHCKYIYSTYIVHCKYKYKNKHSILKIQIQLQYSGKWQEVWSSSYHALANSTRHSVSSKTKHIQRRLFLLQCLHKNT